ncbi:MAG: App1 family protein [bacterium]
MAYVWQIAVVPFSNKLLVSGVILNGDYKKPKKQKKTNFSHVIGSYFKKPFRNRQIIISLGEKRHQIRTGEHGDFLLETEQIPFRDIEIIDPVANNPLPIIQDYPKIFHDNNYPVSVISDIDDTLMVSHTASNWNRIRTLLFIAPPKRKFVSFTRSVLHTIASEKGRIFYVSKSESNLFGLLTRVIRQLNLPEGVLFLTPYLRYKKLLRPKKGKDFKERSIRMIIENSPNKRFILIGDDTQQDMQVYTRIAELYPGRILKIYIHKTRKYLKKDKKDHMDKLMRSGVSFLYFTDQDAVEQELEFAKEIKL